MGNKHRTAARDAIDAIPPQKRAAKIRRTALGLLVLCYAAWAGRAGWPWYAVLGIGGIGAHIASEELVGRSVQWGVGVLRDVLAAIRNGKGDA